MYSLASCGMYTIFKVEHTLQIKKNEVHSQYVCDIPILNGHIGSTCKHMCNVIGYICPPSVFASVMLTFPGMHM